MFFNPYFFYWYCLFKYSLYSYYDLAYLYMYVYTFYSLYIYIYIFLCSRCCSSPRRPSSCGSFVWPSRCGSSRRPSSCGSSRRPSSCGSFVWPSRCGSSRLPRYSWRCSAILPSQINSVRVIHCLVRCYGIFLLSFSPYYSQIPSFAYINLLESHGRYRRRVLLLFLYKTHGLCRRRVR